MIKIRGPWSIKRGHEILKIRMSDLNSDFRGFGTRWGVCMDACVCPCFISNHSGIKMIYAALEWLHIHNVQGDGTIIHLSPSFLLAVSKKKLTCRALPLKAKPSTKCWFSLPPVLFRLSAFGVNRRILGVTKRALRRLTVALLWNNSQRTVKKKKEMHHNQCTHVLVKSRHLHFSQCYLTAGLLLASSRDVDVYRGLAALLVPSFSLIRSRCYQYIKLPLSVVISPSSTY